MSDPQVSLTDNQASFSSLQNILAKMAPVIVTLTGNGNTLIGASGRSYDTDPLTTLFRAQIERDNQGPATLALDGGTRYDLVTNDGNVLTAGDLTLGAVIDFAWDGTQYRIVSSLAGDLADARAASDQAQASQAASELAQAAAETAQGAAETAQAAASGSEGAAAASEAAAAASEALSAQAAAAAGSTIYADTIAGLAGTADGETFLVAAGEGLALYTNNTGAAQFENYIGRVIFEDLAAVQAYDGSALPEGLRVQVRDGQWYAVAPAAATDHKITTAGGDKLFEAGPGFTSDVDFRAYSEAADRGWRDGADVILSGDRAGARFVFDPASTETANNLSVFAPAGGGRFKLDENALVPLSSLGLVDSDAIDQSVKFQEAIKIYSAERWRMLFDLARVDCGGADIWMNVEGAANGYSAGTRFHWEGVHRNYNVLSNVYLTFGKTYTDESVADDGSDLRWSISRQPTSQAVLRNLSIEGCARFINIEGTFRADSLKFEPETGDSNFLSALPASWGQNHLGVTDTNGDAVAVVPYAHAYAVTEFLYCNHMLVTGCNFQNGKDLVVNGSDDRLTGLSLSQCSNPLILGGRTVSNDTGCLIGAHPVLGGTGLSNVQIIGQHTEENIGYAYHITHGKNISINQQGRPQDDGNDMDKPMVLVDSSANAPTNVQITGWFSGPGSNQGPAKAIVIDGGVNVSVAGYIQNFGVGVEVLETIRLGDINCTWDNVDDEIRVAPGVAPNANDDALSDFSPLSFVKGSRGQFWDLSQGAGGLLEFAGVGVTSERSEEGLAFTIPASGTEDMESGFKLSTGKVLEPANCLNNEWADAVHVSGSILSSTSNVEFFVGLSTQSDVASLPAVVTGAGAITATDDDFIGFLFSRYASGAMVHLVARNNGGTPLVVETDIEFGSTSGAFEYQLDVKRDGDARFRINGALFEVAAGDYVADGAIDDNELFGLTVAGHSLTASAATMTVPWLAYRVNRGRT